MRDIGAMSGKHLHGFVAGSFAQGAIEAAFAQVFNVPLERIKVLRGRIKHLMVVGLPSTKPGKGARVLYGQDVILRWLIALIFEDCSVTPVGAVKAVERVWEFFPVDRWVERALDAESATNPVYITLRPQFAKLAWDEHAPPAWVNFIRRWDTRELPAEMLAHIKEKWGPEGERYFRDNLRSFHDSVEAEGSWACVRNLTRDLKVLRDCLEPADASEGAKSRASANEYGPSRHPASAAKFGSPPIPIKAANGASRNSTASATPTFTRSMSAPRFAPERIARPRSARRSPKQRRSG
jgi:hypothetical protein